MGHLIDPPESPLQRVIPCAQRTIAIAVVGCAALALWAGPATAADSPLSDSTPGLAAGEIQTPVPPVPATDVPPVVDQVTDTVEPVTAESVETASLVPAQTPGVPQISTPAPPVQMAAADPAPVIRDVTSKASASIEAAAPASDAVTATKVTQKASAAPAIHGLPAGDAVKQTLANVSNSADLDGATGSVPNVVNPSPPANQFGADPIGHGMHRGGMTPPRSIAASAISISVKHVIAAGTDRSMSPASLLTMSPASFSTTDGPSNAGPSSAPVSTATDSGPSLPGLPGPVQIPALGSSAGSTTSSNGFFLFGFAGLLVGLWAAFAPALSRRVQGSPASWRPAPYLSLLELPG